MIKSDECYPPESSLMKPNHANVDMRLGSCVVFCEIKKKHFSQSFVNKIHTHILYFCFTSLCFYFNYLGNRFQYSSLSLFDCPYFFLLMSQGALSDGREKSVSFKNTRTHSHSCICVFVLIFVLDSPALCDIKGNKFHNYI